MDIFTDVDIFKELVDASIRGVPVYILLDHKHFKSFLTMIDKQDIQLQKLRVSVCILLYINAQVTSCFKSSQNHTALHPKEKSMITLYLIDWLIDYQYSPH